MLSFDLLLPNFHTNATASQQRLIGEVDGDAFPELLNALKYRITLKRILADHLYMTERAITHVQVRIMNH